MKPPVPGRRGHRGGKINARRPAGRRPRSQAWIAQAEAGEAGAADEARAAFAGCNGLLGHPVAGGVYDRSSGGNSLIATIPASSFYNVLCAVVERRVLG